MRKVSRILFVMALTVGFAASAAMAGTLALSGNIQGKPGPFLIAQEVVDGTQLNPIPVGDKITAYRPALPQPPGSIIEPAFTLEISSGVLTVGPNPTICRDGGVPIANFASLTGGTRINFVAVAGESLANGVVYYIGDPGCNVNPFVLRIGAIPAGTTSVDVTLTAGINAAVQDTSTTRIVDVIPQYTAEIDQKLNDQIDPKADFKMFTDGDDDDVLVVDINRAPCDRGTIFNNGDRVTITIDMTTVEGLSAFSLSGNGPGPNPALTCNINTTTKVATCTRVSAFVPGQYFLNFTTNGDTIGEKKFAVTAQIDFATLTYRDHTLAADWPLVQMADAGQWLRFGFIGRVPYISTLSQFVTICLVNNTSENDTDVYFEVLSSQGGTSSDSINIGTVKANTTRRFDINGKVTPYVGNNPSTPGTPIALPGLAADDKYSGLIYIPNVPDQTSVSCVQVENNGPKRLVPVLTRWNQEFWQQ